MRQRRLIATLCCVVLAIAGMARADAYDPPAGYYNGATGTGATLKSQLTTIMSTGHIQRTYGDFRFSAEIHDADPNIPGNILLVYNRASVPAAWDSTPSALWNREHVWPQSLQPGSVSNSTMGNLGDPHSLRPANPGINTARGNKPFGFETTTGNYGAVSGGYYFPGDADKGDIARQLFYSDTRWSSLGLSLTDSFPSGNQMGDLSSLIAWHYLDVPDEFERHRNHSIYSQALNPTYYTNNRNAFIDRPEYVWSIYVDQMNDSQLSIAGGTPVGNGGSTRDVDLGRVFVGGAVPAAQNFLLSKTGDDGTFYEVTAAGDATSSINGRYNAFAIGGPANRQITVGIDSSPATTAAAGLRNGAVTIDNLDVTTGLGAGFGANDANDQFNISLAVVDHATASFADGSTSTSLVYDFGSVAMGSTAPNFNFDIFNLEQTVGFTADLDFDGLLASGDDAVLTTDLAAAAGSLSLAAGAGQSFSAMLSTAALGSFSATYTLLFSDEDILGALNSSLTLTLMGSVLASSMPGDYNGNGVVDAADYVVWRKSYGESVPAYSGADGDGDESIGDGDFIVWTQHFGAVGPGAGAASAAVPEPATALVLIAGVAILAAVMVRIPRPAVVRLVVR